MRTSLFRRLSRHSAALPVALAGGFLAACGGGGASSPAGPPPPGQGEARAAFGTQLPRAPVEPLSAVGVPDVNEIGLLEGAGGWTAITRTGQRASLRALGKALFWDMQVGADGLQACASCHYHAGADNRITHQIHPGRGDLRREVAGINETLRAAHYGASANGRPNAGFGVDEAALLAAGASPDAPDGSPGRPPASRPAGDTNDIASSQGVRAGTFRATTAAGDPAARIDGAVLLDNDAATASDAAFGARSAQLPPTARRVADRNSPSVLNAVYNLRNFWDGRASMYFNGVNPFGPNDAGARVKVWRDGALADERLDVPFSSLASQAVGPIGNTTEMSFEGRRLADLGRKLTQPGAQPLRGQWVDPADSLLGGLRASGGRGLAITYDAWIRGAFDARFWGDGAGNDVCLDESGRAETPAVRPAGSCPRYSLLQWNFPLFFGLAVQAYEARLTTSQTLVDLLAGGIATGTVVNGPVSVPVEGLALEGCIAAASRAQSAAAQAAATALCTTHYAKFMDPGTRTGSESNTAPFPVPANTPVGGKCGGASGAQTSTGSANEAAECRQARDTLLNVNEGLKRFFSGNTACSVCHFNPEFTGATVSAQTRFGARLPALPNGQLRKELEARAVMERMLLANGAPAVYDVGFYNIGVRPTVEDIAVGAQVQGVPLAFSRLARTSAGGDPGSADAAAASAAYAALGALRIPTSPGDLTPLPFPLFLGCGPGLVGSGNASSANNNPVPRCRDGVAASERLQVNGSFKTPGLRNVALTGPYFHNGSKSTLRQVLEFYKTGGHFGQINHHNLDAGMRTISLSPSEESALVELMETGLTDWRVAFKRAPFDHPELCLPHGHEPDSGATRIVGIPAVGAGGSAFPIATFAEMLGGAPGPRSHRLDEACTMPGIAGTPTAEAPGVPGVPPGAFTSLIDWVRNVLSIASDAPAAPAAPTSPDTPANTPATTPANTP